MWNSTEWISIVVPFHDECIGSDMVEYVNLFQGSSRVCSGTVGTLHVNQSVLANKELGIT
jgi:hypothetical protein